MEMNDEWSRELPAAGLPSIPHWSENYAWNAYDPVSKVSLFLSLGRWSLDPAMWREFIGVCIGGITYSRRNIGRLHDPKIVGACCLQIECVQPLKRWHLRYHGPALQGTTESLLLGQPDDTVCSLLDFELDWDAGSSPLIDFGHGTESTGATNAVPDPMSSHYEQGGIAAGSFTVDGVRHDFNAHSMRDHSRGPRQHKSSFGRHSWINAHFPSGRSIASLTLERPDKTMAMAALFAADKNRVVSKYQFDEILLWESWEGRHDPYVLNASNERGEKIRIEAVPIVSYPQSIAHPSDVYVGQSNHFEGWRIFEMPTRMVWDGEETCGWTEISFTPEKSRQHPGKT